MAITFVCCVSTIHTLDPLIKINGVSIVRDLTPATIGIVNGGGRKLWPKGSIRGRGLGRTGGANTSPGSTYLPRLCPLCLRLSQSSPSLSSGQARDLEISLARVNSPTSEGKSPNFSFTSCGQAVTSPSLSPGCFFCQVCRVQWGLPPLTLILGKTHWILSLWREGLD